MNPRIKYGLCFLSVLLVSYFDAQEKGRSYDRIEYRRDADYQGPDQWGANSPSSMRSDEVPIPSEFENPGQIDYTEEEIKRLRRANQMEGEGTEGGDRKGTIVREPESLELPEIDDSRSKNSNPSGPPDWLSKLFLIAVIIAAAFGLGSLLIRLRRKGSLPPMGDIELQEDPTKLTQSEFDRLLAAAIAEDNFREAVRLYFVAILKELILKELIQWKKDKTNETYTNELNRTVFGASFANCVRLYEYVWYGNYSLSLETYGSIEVDLKELMKKIQVFDAK
jgi:hypothetical protein